MQLTADSSQLTAGSFYLLTVSPHHGNRSFTFVQDDALTFLYKDHGVGRQKELLAHVVRLRILACRNDLNRKRIVSLQLIADS